LQKRWQIRSRHPLLTKISAPGSKRPPVERPQSCEDGSLSCTWTKLSVAVRNAFASSGGANR
jgi:hypothetical protein